MSLTSYGRQWAVETSYSTFKHLFEEYPIAELGELRLGADCEGGPMQHVGQPVSKGRGKRGGRG